MAAIELLPMTRNAWLKPIVVSVLPSPNLVGVTAVTTTYFDPLALGPVAGGASRWILALVRPYRSISESDRPISPATSAIGLSCAALDISRSVFTILFPFFILSGPHGRGVATAFPDYLDVRDNPWLSKIRWGWNMAVKLRQDTTTGAESRNRAGISGPP
jgi:hypothetical protein